MLDRVTKFIVARLSGKLFKDDEEAYLYLILCVATVFSGSIHVVLLAFFAVIGIPIMVTLNIASVLIYVLCLFFVFRRHYTAAGLLISLEIVAFAILTMLLTGFYTFVIFYFVLVLILQIIVPFKPPWVRTGICALIIAFLLFQVHLEIGYQPLYSLGDYYALFSSFNIIVSLFAVAAELFASAYIRSVIAHLREVRTAELESLANTDTLTGLYNRRYAELLFERIRQEEPGRDWYVAMLDIDYFKTINDTYGHAIGDLALTELAKLLKGSLRSSDVIFRWGGEEFLLLLSVRTSEIAVTVLEKIRKGVAELKTSTDTLCFQFTVTIGTTQLDLDRIEDCIAECDTKLYAGKKNGRNQVVI